MLDNDSDEDFFKKKPLPKIPADKPEPVVPAKQETKTANSPLATKKVEPVVEEVVKPIVKKPEPVAEPIIIKPKE